MCTILFSFRSVPGERLVLLANRDEFYNRPTAAAGTWEDAPDVYAGRDLVAGGTWLGVTGSGRIAAVTNYRDPGQAPGELSRGALVADFLKGDASPREYLREIEKNAGRYTGFNLIVGDILGAGSLFYFSNRGEGIEELGTGLYGLSNHLLNTPWPKVRRGKERLRELLDRGAPERDLFGLLADRTIAPDEELPDTGVGIEIERQLSPIFIETPIYGTRSSTVVRFSDEGGISFEEKVHV